MPSYKLPELPYDYSALEPHLSEQVLELHHDKHHAAYVEGANETLGKLTDARAKDDFGLINQLQKDLAFHVSGHVLHSVFWLSMSPDGGGTPQGDFAAALAEHFGSFAACKQQLDEVASGVQGSGWAALVWEPVGQCLLTQQIYDHQSNLTNGSVPLLTIDMWEHAYYLQYQNRKADWLAAFWEIADWGSAARRYKMAREVDLGLG
jgi:superoxide dismutase, Fe-Mn family